MLPFNQSQQICQCIIQDIMTRFNKYFDPQELNLRSNKQYSLKYCQQTAEQILYLDHYKPQKVKVQISSRGKIARQSLGHLLPRILKCSIRKQNKLSKWTIEDFYQKRSKKMFKTSKDFKQKQFLIPLQISNSDEQSQLDIINIRKIKSKRDNLQKKFNQVIPNFLVTQSNQENPSFTTNYNGDIINFKQSKNKNFINNYKILPNYTVKDNGKIIINNTYSYMNECLTQSEQNIKIEFNNQVVNEESSHPIIGRRLKSKKCIKTLTQAYNAQPIKANKNSIKKTNNSKINSQRISQPVNIMKTAMSKFQKYSFKKSQPKFSSSSYQRGFNQNIPLFR